VCKEKEKRDPEDSLKVGVHLPAKTPSDIFIQSGRRRRSWGSLKKTAKEEKKLHN